MHDGSLIDYARLPLDRQHADFVRHKFLAMPIAGTIAWTAIRIAGALLPLVLAGWATVGPERQEGLCSG